MKIRFTLSGQMSAGYLFIVLVAALVTFVCYRSLNTNEELENKVQQVYSPVYLSLKDLNELQYNSLRLTNRWIFQPNPEDKQTLIDIHKVDYLALKRRLEKICTDAHDAQLTEEINGLLTDVQKMLLGQNEIMELLKTDSSYNPVRLDKAIKILDRNITPNVKQIESKLDKTLLFQKNHMQAIYSEKAYNRVTIIYLLIGMLVFCTVASIASYYFTVKKVVKPIMQLKQVIVKMGEGDMVDVKFNERNDEIGLIMKAIKGLMVGMNARLTFAEQIGNGNYTDTSFTLLSDKDAMGKALIDMRQNLKRNAENERQRNWSVAGLAEFAEIIRNENDFQKLGDAIISNLVRYTDSNQGGLFICESASEDSEEEHLKLLSCYAWDKKKFEERIIYRGQGLVGQCWEEGAPIFMSQVPADYVNITSGLGYATPRCIFIVPLKVNETIYGVLELASFEPYKTYKQDFIVKVCENIASAVAAARTNEQTRKLLQLSRQQAEEMRAQEEEMRQNMEELAATQDEMMRVLTETQNKERFLQEMMNASTDSIVTFDHAYKVLSYNRAAIEEFKRVGIRLEAGANLLTLLSSYEGLKQIYDRALAGELMEMENESEGKNYIVHYVPIRSVDGAVTAVAVFIKDVTVIMQAKQEADRLLTESQAQEEELRQTMEELQATMESEAKRTRELERNAAQLEAQKQMMTKTIEKLRIQEAETRAKSDELALKEQQVIAQQTMMEQTVREFIENEAVLRQQLEEKEQIIAALSNPV
ncbi:MAG TPA: GAF domain-containing protein [Ohtaekwangia sp.]|uniref:GAF domain-containing protein n=1 Tax=Ohtaekwangia sp. TaxID=2066019 RepID=UPI002F94657E